MYPYKKYTHFLKGARHIVLSILLLFFCVVLVHAATTTWTFNASTSGSYTFDATLVAVDNSGAGPISGVNKFTNPSFESNLTGWTYQAVTALTTSGGLITDATRTTNTDGDGLTPPAGFGIWEAATNLITNGGFESNTTGWAPGGTGTIASSLEQAKFGTHSGKWIINSNNAILGPATTITAVAHALSVWVYIPSDWDGGLIQVSASNFTSSTLTIGSANMSLTNQWQRVTGSVLPDSGDLIGNIRVQFVSPPTVGRAVYIDGVQVEQQPLATPYVETNGSTASRTSGYIQAPSGIFNTTQGWITFRTRMGWGSTAEPYGGALQVYLFDWRDLPTSLMALRYREASNDIAFTRRNSTTSEASVPITITKGDLLTVTAAWTASAIKISLNGAAFSSTPDTAIPTILASFVSLGTQSNTLQMDSELLWFAAGSGTLTDADAATINGFGNTPPETSSFPETSTVTGLWPAVTSAWTSGSLYRNTATTYLSSAASGKLYAAQTANFTQSINVGNTDTYTFDAYAYTDGSAVSSSDLSLFYNGSTISTTYTSMGSGWYKLTGSLTGASASRSYGVQVASGKTVYVDDLTLYKTGNYTVYNTNAFSEPAAISWDSFSQSITATGNSGVTYQICLDDSASCSYSTGSRWQYYTGGAWTNAVDASATYSNTAAQLTGTAMTSLSVINHKISVKSIFSFGGAYSPLLSSLSIGYSTPTPTQTPSSGGGESSSSSNNNPSPQTCSQTPPLQAPNLYAAVPQNGNSTLLYFTNGQTPLDHYSLEFGTKSGSYQYGADNIGNANSRTYLVSFLSPNTTYYFRVRGGNGCAPGPWSNEISSKTTGFVTFNSVIITNTSLSTASDLVKAPAPTPTKIPTPTLVKKVTPTVIAPTKKLTPTPTKVEVTPTEKITVTPTSAPDLDSSSEATSSAITDGYNVSVVVRNEEGEVVEGAEITVHSKVQKGKTDKNGVVRFANVEAGEHKVLIAYDGFMGEESIHLMGAVKDVTLNVTIKLSRVAFSPIALVVVGILIVVIIGMAIGIIFLLKRRGGPPAGKRFNFSFKNRLAGRGLA